MGEAIGNVLPMAVGVAISPVPIIAVVLMLGTPSARVNGPLFAVGWVSGLAAVGGTVLLLAKGNATNGSGEPSTWASVLKLALGVLFVGLAARTWRTRPAAHHEAATPAWMRRIDTFGPGKAVGAGALLSSVNPKNLALSVAAATAIAAGDVSGGRAAGALAVFVILGSLSILTPVVIYFAFGRRAASILDALKASLSAHNAAIMTVLFLVLGAKLIGDAISGFSA